MERESPKQVKDKHRHQPLLLSEKPLDVGKCSRCWACDDLLSGQTYHCAECILIHLHKRCAEAPSEVNDLPVCQEHFRLSLKVGLCSDKCFFCREIIYEIFYSCDGSGDSFVLCMKCALFIINNNENNGKLKLDYHTHPLAVVANHKDELARINCHACTEALSDSICVCFDCGLFLHKKCTDQLPLEINHPCHRRHPLFLDLKKQNSSSCEICKEEEFVGLSYGCCSCKFYIHLKCAFLGSFNNIADHETHQHTFNVVWRRDPFICEACGNEGHYASKVCSTCHINVHMKCTSLPRHIRIVRHPDHPISHNYFVKENGSHQKHVCRICYDPDDEVKNESGCYSCSKEDCNYIVHVNCALVEGNYWVIDEGHEPEVSVMESFQIIEKNHKGEVVKIQHFVHDHYLILGDKIREGDDNKYCDGCMTFLSDAFYYCSQCDFFLHKTCAELPKKKNYWFHPHPITLELASISLLTRGEQVINPIQASFLPCKFCHRVGSGLFYCCYECNDNSSAKDLMVVCLRCARLPDAYDPHPGHEHLIFFYSNYDEECISCGSILCEMESIGWERLYIYRDGAFKCKECSDYGVDFKCMTLPIEARHKCDKHVLRLVYRDENDPKKHYCDVCEEKREKNHWFYLCSICDNSVHPECVLGEHPFINIGSTLTNKDVHPHPLTFFKKEYYYPKCNECGKPCLDLAIECAQSECNYILHSNCLLDRL